VAEVRVSAILLLFLASCQFDRGGVDFGDGGTTTGADASRPGDGNGGGDACVPGCSGDVLTRCQPSPSTETCPLGCNGTTISCRALVPSNGASAQNLQGVTDGLVVPAASAASIDSSDGTVIVDGSEVRPGGEGLAAGMRFTVLGDNIGVLAVDRVDIGVGAVLRVRGKLALIILSRGDATLDGVIDVSAGCADGSVICGGPGAGTGSTSEDSDSTGCAPGGHGHGSFGLEPETGGGGGGFGGAGETGGAADSTHPGGTAGVPGGACAGASLVPLMGGAAGGAGGSGGNGGDGGGGGGALQLTSFTAIHLAGASAGAPAGVRASGAGGRGGEGSDGGGGGGAGGGVLLEAPAIDLSNTVLAANGGGGGGGGGSPDTDVGEPGPFGQAQAAGGGADSHAGGSGGSVASGPTAGAGGGDDTGGGGGGVGIIRLNAPLDTLNVGGNVIVSPAYTRGDPAAQ